MIRIDMRPNISLIFSTFPLILLIFPSILYCSQLEKLIDELESTIKEAESEVANPDDYPKQYNPIRGESFDFVVVGAGTAGCVVASRLSEVPGWTVLLLEAGGDPTQDSDVPAFAGSLQMTDLDWQYTTDPEENVCLSHVNRSCRWPRGKVLGGSSVINSLLYSRGNSRDYDEWEAAGNAGWGYEDVLPYFRKSEDLRAANVLGNRDALRYHGVGGCLTVENPEIIGNPLEKIFRSGFEELGYPLNPDYNGRRQGGFFQLLNFLRNHRRCSNAKAFLSPARHRKNLMVSKYSLVTRIVIDERTLTATGVEFMTKNGRKIHVRARKEVILSAGAINSPQLLMLSGVGPRRHLQDLGIRVLQDLPVGEDLQDHPQILNLIFYLDRSPLEHANLENPAENTTAQSTLGFLLGERSSLSVQNGLDCGAFINTSCSNGFPFLQMVYTHFGKNDCDGVRSYLERASFGEETIAQITRLNRDHFIVTWTISLVKVFSRGRILLGSPDPLIHPEIVTGYFQDPRDMENLLTVFTLFYDLAQTEGVRNAGARLFEVRVSACEKYGFPSRAYRECSVRHLVTTAYHPSCTCGMGRVVDAALRVKGVSRLRVVDASVMPSVSSGNTNAPVTMIGEKGSDIIKDFWANRF